MNKLIEMAKINKEDLINLSSDEIKQFYEAEHYQNIKNPIIKEFVSGGKDTYTIGNRINRVENILNLIIVERFLTNTL